MEYKNPIFNLVYRFFKRKERKFFLEADHVISLTYAGKEEIVSWNGLEHLNNKIEVIPCCADLTLFDPTQIDTKKKNLMRKNWLYHLQILFWDMSGQLVLGTC